MNKALRLFIIIATALFFHSCGECKNYQSEYTIDSVIKSMFSKSGSYFVYNDSIDNIIDSQYVSYYNYSVGSFYMSTEDGCESFSDQIHMTQRSYHNGLFYDTIYTTTYPGEISLGDSKLTILTMWPAPYYSGDTVINSFNVGSIIYPTVYKGGGVDLIENSDTVPTDLYFAPNYGIVKRVEHRPTGDVSWDLIRYHIVH